MILVNQYRCKHISFLQRVTRRATDYYHCLSSRETLNKKCYLNLKNQLNSIMKEFLILLLLLSSCSNQRNLEQEKISKTTGAVASAHPLATKAGQTVLDNGGNAFDAAIAVASTLNVVEPMMSGIGGYGTILIYDAKNERVRFLNPSGRFPSKTNSDLMRTPTPDYKFNRVGPKSISTPGNLNAWKSMHELYGQSEWASLFVAAINHAQHGFVITDRMAQWIGQAFDDFSPYSQSIYGKGGISVSGGELLIQKDLSKTLKIVSEEGTDPFYHGAIARAIDEQLNEVGSFLSLEDLEANEAEWWEPLKMKYKGYDVYTASLPANSFPALVNLGLMQQFPEQEHNSVDYLHLFAEMTKESYKSRLAYSFDPDIKAAPIDSILSTQVLRSMADDIDKNQASVFVPPFSAESKNTTHFVVVDKWGNVVSATQTLGNSFGSRIMVEGTGVWLNNSMAYSTFEPKGNPMDAFAGRHKLSGDCPVIIMKDGRPWAALGSPGGHTITQNVPQIIFNLIDFGMTMQQAIDEPKITFVEPNRIRADHDLPKSTIEALRARGHNISIGSIGNASGIRLIYDKTENLDSLEIGIDKRGEGRASIVDH